ncbi:MAG TPA: hypothetical protein VKD08_08795 [Ignavibacteriaceae bacterium]|nr:hypothetical protein [Ignavibacteriaceae bacterium]
MQKTFTKFVLFFITAVLFTGCLEVNTTIHLNKDGSGTLEESVLMSSQVVQMISAFASSFDSTAADTNQFSLFKEDQLIADTSKYGSGVKYISGKEVKEDGREGYNVVYSFNNINDLRINQNPNSKIDMEGVEFEEDSAHEFLHFDFSPGETALLTIKMPSMKDQDVSNEVPSQDTASSNTEGMDELLKLMKDMRIALTLDVKGQITQTNASYVNGSSITLFDINFNDLLDNPEKLKMFKQQNPKNLEEIKKIVENLPGVKVELNNPVSIRFE